MQVISPDGSRVYCTVRLGRDFDPMEAAPAAPFGVEDNQLATFAVGADGKLALLDNVSTGGSMPWGCAVTPGGGGVVVQNQYESWAGEDQGIGGQGIGQLVSFGLGEGGRPTPVSSAQVDNLMCLATATLGAAKV